jgi:hypothetical protein
MRDLSVGPDRSGEEDSMTPCPKGKTRKQLKAAKDRRASIVQKLVRAACCARDLFCRVGTDSLLYDHTPVFTECSPVQEWAHMHSHRRSQTRGQAAEKRHTTMGSLMLCRHHHAEYDAHQLKITALTRAGADGPLKFTRAR